MLKGGARSGAGQGAWGTIDDDDNSTLPLLLAGWGIESIADVDIRDALRRHDVGALDAIVSQLYERGREDVVERARKPLHDDV